MAVSKEELNKIAHGLAARAQLLYAAREGPRAASDPETLEELAADCARLRTEIHQLRAECERLPAAPPTEHDSEELLGPGLLLKEKRLKAELAVLEREEAKVLSTREPAIQSQLYQQVQESVSQLYLVLSTIRKEREAVQEKLKWEQELLKESRELEEALQKELSKEIGTRTPIDPAVDLRERVELAKQSIRTLQENLIQFTSDELLQPSDTATENRGKRKCGQTTLDSVVQRGGGKRGEEVEQPQFPSLAAVIQDLISKVLSSPHSPYLPLSSVWPPHANLLLRSEVIQRHPDNPTLIRITPFHL